MHDIGDSGAYQIEKIWGGGRERGEGALGKATRSPRRPLPTPLRRGGGGTQTPRALAPTEEECARRPRLGRSRRRRASSSRACLLDLVVPPMRPWRIGDGQLNLKRNGPWEASVRTSERAGLVRSLFRLERPGSIVLVSLLLF